MTHTRSALAFVGLALAAGCARSNASGEEHAVTALVAGATDTGNARATDEPGELRAVASVLVEGQRGPGGKSFDVAARTGRSESGHNREFGRRRLQIAGRTGARDLLQYPCNSCHVGRTIMAPERIDDAHGDLTVVHPAETGASCATCHAADDVALLALPNNERASFDHAYRLCAQCHSSQLAAWSGGAHGKRLDGWQGRRVMMSCTDCHDPHAPAIAARMPFRPPRLHRTEKQ